jgi:hypothetical protein
VTNGRVCLAPKPTLDTHEVVLAEGVPAETCFMTGRDYENFSNFGEYERLYGP